MTQIIFATTNASKAETLQEYFNLTHQDVEIVQQPLELIEEQADDALQVTQSKARQAYEQLKQPVVVDDSAFHIPALNGFPGVYQKYVAETIGPEGILKLMEDVTDRSAYFVSNLVYIDENGEAHSFSDSHYEGSVSRTYDPEAKYGWGIIGKIFIPKGAHAVATELSPEERRVLQKAAGFKDAYEDFANWYKQQS